MAYSSKETIQIAVNEDVEAIELHAHGLERGPDGLIRWRRDSPDHPRNWSSCRKVFDITVIIFFEFFVYNLGQAFGSLFIPPLSEIGGRRLPYLISCALFSLSCIAVAAIPHWAAIWIGRFIGGFASAVPAVVTAGSVEDLFNTRTRIWIVVLWNGGSTAGLCFGPIYAAYIQAACGWKWVYYSSAIVTAVTFLCLIGVRESRPSKILKAKITELTGCGKIHNLDWHNPDHSPDMASFVSLVVIRPVHLLCTEPLVIMVTAISSISWGIIYFFTESLTIDYTSMGFSKTQASLPFLAMASGVLLTLFPRLWDTKVAKRRQAQHKPVEPEDKIMAFAFAAPALAVGLAWYAWTVPPAASADNVPWIAPTLALAPVGFAVNEMAYTLSGYLADAYLLYAASAFCGLAFVRALVSGLMPLAARGLHASLGANLAGTVVAALALVFCAAPWVLFRYSRRLRRRSPFARFSLESHRRTQIDPDGF
ncbi:S-adenosyl-L-methionine-dependent methyltransferase [Apiospora arundinis]